MDLKDAIVAADIHEAMNLLEQGANPNEVFQEESMLHLAARKGNLDMVRLLMRYGAILDTESNTRYKPHNIAAYFGHLDVLEFFLEQGNLYRASLTEREFEDEDIPIEGVDVNKKDYDGWTLLHYATQGGSIEAIRYLLKRGARLNEQTKECLSTPLHLAPNTNCLRELIYNGADYTILDAYNKDALYWMSIEKREQFLEECLFIEYKEPDEDNV